MIVQSASVLGNAERSGTAEAMTAAANILYVTLLDLQVELLEEGSAGCSFTVSWPCGYAI